MTRASQSGSEENGEREGHKAQLTYSARCRRIVSRLHLQAVTRRQEEAARQQRLAHWQVFQPTTRSYLQRVAAVGGAVLAVQLAEAIRSERERSSVPADRGADQVTGAA